MECTEVFFESMNLLLGFGTLVAAGAAAYCAFRAYEKQEEQTRILMKQHEKFTDAYEAERRAKGPHFFLDTRFGDISSIDTQHGVLRSDQYNITPIGGYYGITGSTKQLPWLILLRNAKTNPFNFKVFDEEVDLEVYRGFTGEFLPETPDVSNNGWALIFPPHITERKFKILFEMEDGFRDIQEYEFRIQLDPVHKILTRLDCWRTDPEAIRTKKPIVTRVKLTPPSRP